MFLSWFDNAHHDHEPGRMGRGPVLVSPGFPLNTCGNDELPLPAAGSSGNTFSLAPGSGEDVCQNAYHGSYIIP